MVSLNTVYNAICPTTVHSKVVHKADAAIVSQTAGRYTVMAWQMAAISTALYKAGCMSIKCMAFMAAYKFCDLKDKVMGTNSGSQKELHWVSCNQAKHEFKDSLTDITKIYAPRVVEAWNKASPAPAQA